MKKTTAIILMLVLALSAGAAQITNPVKVSDAGKEVTLSNGMLEFTFEKKGATLTSIKQAGQDLLGGYGRGYLMGPGFSMSPSTYKLVRQTPGLAEISFTHEAANGYFFEMHYVLLTGESGIYCFLEQYHHAGSPDGGFGQIRWGLRADSTLYDYHLVRDNIQGPMPTFADFKKKMQDWTYQLPDSSYYTKYDYADYIEGRHVHGYAGQKSGKGLFVIQASHEYLNGGPTKQFNTVHTTPFMIMMFQCDHFLLDKKKDDGPISGEWQKLGGPFFLYVNSGKNITDIWCDAKRKADEEVAKWPYKWMDHPDYPLQRGTVTGQLQVTGASAAYAHIILAAPGVDWQAQSHGYIFAVRADKDGNFTIPNIRPGKYSLYAFTDNVTEEFCKNEIEVKANQTVALNKIVWTPKQNGTKLWQIGFADRTTRGFKLSDHKRYYGVFNNVPADLTYTVGKSKDSEDWYYAQTKPGSWNVKFNQDKASSGEGVLTLGVAGSAKNPTLEVWVNETKAGSYNFGNDHTVYRSSILGGYYQQQEVRFPASLLKAGENIISFRLPNVKNGGGIMYDVIKLEVSGPAQTSAQTFAPGTLPGKGPAQFDFFYAGEAPVQNMYIVRNGKISWAYRDTASKGEISDAVLMKNGNVLFAHQFGVTLINRDKKVLWKYDAPKGYETHTAQPIGKDHVVFIQNGDTAKLFVVNIHTGKFVKQFPLPVGNPKSVHGQFRHARLTSRGTILIAHMDWGKVSEYDINGKQLMMLDVPGVWSVEPLKNGNMLICSKTVVRELKRNGEVVWEYGLKTIPGYQFASPQVAIRRANGNTIIGNWVNLWNGKIDPDNAPVQAIEVTPGKEIVWALRSWSEPVNLGPSTIIQPLNESVIPENVTFGNIR